jgi:RNA-directed DNA polymerase
MTFIEPTAGRGALDDWASIDWPATERNVRRLQERIFRASQNGEHAQVKNLQSSSFGRVPRSFWRSAGDPDQSRQENTGIDGVVCPCRRAVSRCSGKV